MSQGLPVQVETDNTILTLPLAERLDGAIGEATTVIGSVLTEMVRRSLRGGVVQLGDQLATFVAEKVDATIAERTPVIEQTAADVAENTARAAATEVAHEEVRALNQRTQEADRVLAARLDETNRQATETISQKAEALTKKIQDTEKKIDEAEKRVTEKTQATVTEQIEEFRLRSREGAIQTKSRLRGLDSRIAEFGQLLEQEQAGRKESFQSLHQQVQLIQQGFQKEIATLSRLLADANNQIRANAEEMRRLHEALDGRMAELEKPRGIKAFVGKLFGRGKGKEADGAAAEEESS